VTDQFGNVYASVALAAQKLDLHPENIYAVLKNKQQQTGGYSFRTVA
jgi:hypothetical protein